MTDKIREEFERTNARDHRRQPPKGNNYIDPMAQADWESYQKGWKAACESFVVALPEGEWMGQVDPEFGLNEDKVREAIEAAGGTVKVKP